MKDRVIILPKPLQKDFDRIFGKKKKEDKE